jgi:integrase
MMHRVAYDWRFLAIRLYIFLYILFRKNYVRRMKQNAANRYLWFRPQARSIWFRMAVPKKAQGRAGMKVFQCSLETGEVVQARILAKEKSAALYREWGVGDMPPPADPAAIAVRIGFDTMLARLDADRKANWPADDASYTAALAGRESDLRRKVRHLQDGELASWEAIADKEIAKGLHIEKGSATYEAFVRAIATATIDAIGVFNRAAAGELDAGPRTAVVQEAKAKEAAKAKPGETIVELFERWAADRLAKGEKRADTVDQDRKAIEQFAEFAGKDRAIGSITPLEVAEYRDVLRQLPPKWRSNKALKGLDMRAAAAKARERNLAESAFTSVNKHLSTISPLYKWLAGQPAWAGLLNPVNGLFYDKVKGKNRRPSFSTDHLNKMLSSPLFTGFLAEGKEHLPGNRQADDWRKWIPLVCLFTGARIGEIAQLRLGDVRQERGVWFIHIRHDEAAGLATKSGKSRPAAAHSMLERMGFLAFHQRRLERAGGDMTAPLFPELKPNKRGQISGEPSRFWRDYLAAIGVKDGADGFGAHSFRHTLADRLRSEVELLDVQVGIVLGHSQPSVTAGYGELSQGTVTTLKGWMDALRFDGVDFSHLAQIAPEATTERVRSPQAV